MNKIAIGTCVPGRHFDEWAPAFLGEGFERFAVNFHMQFSGVDLGELAKKSESMLAGTGVEVSALGFYCNALANEEQEKQLHDTIDMAEKFHTKVVSTFAGALPGESVDAAMPRFKQVFGELARHAEDKGVRLAIENCPMGGTWEKGTCNIGFCPRSWDRMFDAVPSDSLGLEWEPAHQMCQLIDPVANLRRYVKKVVHIHGKDANVKRDLIAAEGLMCGEDVVTPRFPGFGDTDWRQLFEILMGAGYEGAISIEGYHDKYYKGEQEFAGQLHALNYLKWCRGGDMRPNPWSK